jgi:ABC-type nitrate/sulfonate/bicarbonate transport system substrate-binding protein
MTRFGTMLPDAVLLHGRRRHCDAELARRHADVAVRFLRAMKRGTDYVVDPANMPEILAILPSDGDSTTAERIYALLVDEARGGLVRDFDLDLKGLRAKAQLRQTWHGWDSPLDANWIASERSGVYDMSYQRKALRGQGAAIPKH